MDDKDVNETIWNGWRCSVVVSALASINVVNRHWARLLRGWVTARVCNRPSKSTQHFTLCGMVK